MDTTTLPRPTTLDAAPTTPIPLPDALRLAVARAILAPSGHNTQPWRFRITADAVELHADRTRALPVADPDDRELTIACGAALFHLRLALRHAGYLAEVRLTPLDGPGAPPDLLARVQAGPPAPPTAEEEALFAAIPHRRTNRAPFAARPLPTGLLDALTAAVEQEGAWLRPIDGDARAQVAELVAEADRRQWSDPRFRRELAAWLHPAARGDGLPDRYLHGLGPIVVRTLDLGGGTARQDRHLAETAPALLLLGTAGDTPRDWLAAGQALAHLLLRARLDDVDASYLNQPIQVAAFRPRLAAAVAAVPQLLLRLGYGPPIGPAPRRPLAGVLLPGDQPLP